MWMESGRRAVWAQDRRRRSRGEKFIVYESLFTLRRTQGAPAYQALRGRGGQGGYGGRRTLRRLGRCRRATAWTVPTANLRGREGVNKAVEWLRNRIRLRNRNTPPKQHFTSTVGRSNTHTTSAQWHGTRSAGGAGGLQIHVIVKMLSAVWLMHERHLFGCWGVCGEAQSGDPLMRAVRDRSVHPCRGCGGRGDDRMRSAAYPLTSPP